MAKETQIGGTDRGFPTTLWTSILRATKPDSAIRQETIEKLLAAYWKPVYCCLRFGWNESPEDAKDLVQEFFLSLIERDFFKDVDPAKGRFRAFLKASLKNFMLNERRDAARMKRGGGMKIVSLDGADQLKVAPGDPEEVFDGEWVRSSLERAVGRLREELTAAGKKKHFRVFELYDLSPEDLSYGEVARTVGLSESDVRNYLHHARKALRRIVLQQVGEYALDERDVEEEIRWILG